MEFSNILFKFDNKISDQGFIVSFKEINNIKVNKMKFVPCDEDSQIYSFSRTNKKANHLDLNVKESKFKSNGFKKLKDNKRKKPT